MRDTRRFFFRVEHIDVRIRPRSAAHATVFWALYGVHPRETTPAVDGFLFWYLPDGFRHSFVRCRFGRRAALPTPSPKEN